MFLEKIDWKNPRFKKWNLRNLAPLNKAQQDAFFEDDEIDFPDFSEAELKEIALKFPCRVELFHSNVCYGVEKSWPYRLFGKSKFQDLLPHQKRKLIRTMVRNGVKLYNKFVDEDRLKRRQQQKTELALAEYYQERLLRNRFIRIRALGNYQNVGYTDSESDCSIVTEIENASASASADRLNCDVDVDVNVTKRRPNRITRRHMKPPVEVCGVRRRSSRTKAAIQSKISINVPSPKSSNHRSNQIVPLSRIRKLRTNLVQNSHDDGDMLFLNHKDFPTGDDGIAMLVEVANTMNIPNGDVECQFNIVERIDITDDSPSDSDNDEMLIIDEGFNDDLLSQCTKSSTIENRSICNISSSQLNSNEFVRVESLDIRYMHASFNESVELFLSQSNGN